MWYICHYGVGAKDNPPGRGSGRYPLGSGDRPNQHHKDTNYGIISGTKKSDNKDNKDPKKINRKGHNLELAALIASIGLDVITLNPQGLAYDTIRIGEYVSSVVRLKKIEKRWKNEEIDKNTGFHKKNRTFTEKQDMEAVNPQFRNFNTDTKNNCMLCTSTYELRRRGYDVTANKAGRGYENTAVKEWFPKAEIKDVKGSGKYNSFMGDKEFANNMISELKKQPVGARGNVMIQWSSYAGGHSMVYEVTDSGVIIRDCQSNTIYTKPEKILRKASGGSYARLDNVDFNKKKIKEVCR